MSKQKISFIIALISFVGFFVCALLLDHLFPMPERDVTLGEDALTVGVAIFAVAMISSFTAGVIYSPKRNSGGSVACDKTCKCNFCGTKYNTEGDFCPNCGMRKNNGQGQVT